MVRLIHRGIATLQRIARALRRRRDDARARRELQLLDDYALRDLGLSHRAAGEGRRG